MLRNPILRRDSYFLIALYVGICPICQIVLCNEVELSRPMEETFSEDIWRLQMLVCVI